MPHHSSGAGTLRYISALEILRDLAFYKLLLQ
jgi:hypothetical protein